MRTRILYASALILAATFSFTSCSGDAESSEKEEVTQSCFYSYNESSTELTWTAYKTSDKVPVGGGFNEITVSSDKAETPKDVLESIEFTIETSSVETNNEERNGKVAEHFFGTINTPQITGSIKELKENGKAVVEISMNGISFDVEGDYSLNESDFSLESIIDVSNWNAIIGIDALNEVCKDLHTGNDGVSKLWSEVAIKLTTTLSSDCD